MAHLHRVSAWLLLSVAAHAQALAAEGPWSGSQDGGRFNSFQQCLAAQKSAWDARWSSHVGCRTWTDVGPWREGGLLKGGSSLGGCAGGGVICTAQIVTSCPAGMVLNSDGTGCKSAITCPSVGTPAGDGVFGPLNSEPPDTFCHNGCLVYPDTVMRSAEQNNWWIFGPLHHLGKECVVGPPGGSASNGGDPIDTAPDKPIPAPIMCKKGLCPGQVNDKDVCLPCGEGKDTSQSRQQSTIKDKDGNDVQQTQDVKTTTTCKDGKCTTTTTTTLKTAAKGPDGGPLPSDGMIGETNFNTETTTNADGTKSVTTTTTETQTTCTQAGCSKTTTVTKATSKVAADGSPLSPPTTTTSTDTKKYSRAEFCESQPLNPACRGESSKVETETKDQAFFCKENPKSAFCIESSFGGGCGGPPACTGDAIQCAIASMQHEMKCKLFYQTGTPEQQAYERAIGQTGNVTGDNPNNETISVAGRISTENLFSGQCIGDKTVTVAGATVTLPFSTVCQYLEVLGNVLVAVSMLLAFRIIGRG